MLKIIKKLNKSRLYWTEVKKNVRKIKIQKDKVKVETIEPNIYNIDIGNFNKDNFYMSIKGNLSYIYKHDESMPNWKSYGIMTQNGLIIRDDDSNKHILLNISKKEKKLCSINILEGTFWILLHFDRLKYTVDHIFFSIVPFIFIIGINIYLFYDIFIFCSKYFFYFTNNIVMSNIIEFSIYKIF